MIKKRKEKKNGIDRDQDSFHGFARVTVHRAWNDSDRHRETLTLGIVRRPGDVVVDPGADFGSALFRRRGADGHGTGAHVARSARRIRTGEEIAPNAHGPAARLDRRVRRILPRVPG